MAGPAGVRCQMSYGGCGELQMNLTEVRCCTADRGGIISGQANNVVLTGRLTRALS